ncbi:MAG: TonB-dependent receptor [Bacteroidota bacterium]
MKYTILIAIFFLQINTFAQDSTKTQILDQVIVTANFQETEIRKVARNISIITAKDIENAPVKTLDGILQYALNVDVRSRGPLGVQADISIRGGHYDQTLILLDGVKLNDPQTGHHSLNLPIAMDRIERIEVLQGGGSRVYGPAAFSGVINIITKRNQSTQLNLGYVIGENGLKNANLGGVLKTKKTTTNISFENIKSDGFSKNTAFNRSLLAFKSIYEITANTELSFSAGRFENEFGAANYYSPSFYNQFEMVSSNLVVAQLKHNIGNNFTTNFTASHRRHYDFYDFDNYRKTKPTSLNVHQTDVNDLNWINKLVTKWGTSSIGLEYRTEEVLSNRLGEILKNPIPVTAYGSDYSLEYNKSKIRKNTSAYFEQLRQWEKATLAFGTLINMNNQFGTDWFPGIDYSYSISSKSNVYGSINRSLRFPTFTEMYLTGATVKGDPNLKPEDAWTFEMGTKRNTDYSQLSSSVFYKHSNSAIDKVKRPELSVPTMETIGNMNTHGFEISYALNINKLANNPLYFLQRIQLNYAYLKSDKKEENYQSFYTLNYLKNKASIGINWRLAKNLSLDTWYTYKARAGQYQWDSKTPAVNYAPINLVDARLNFTQKYFRIFLDGTNLFNKSYYEFGFVEQPKRWLSGGISINLR